MITTARPWTKQELADHLRVSLRTVNRMIANGEIDTIKLGNARRIPLEAVQDLLYRRRMQAEENRPRPGRP